MATQDNLAPTALNKKLEVTKVTDRTITIKWDKANDDLTKAKEIRYVVGITESHNASDPWHIVAEQKDIDTFTFSKLKASTCYSFYVMAFDEAGNFVQYPFYNGSMRAATTEAVDDTTAPTVVNKGIKVTKVTENSIVIEWAKATDDLSLAKEIRYVVGLTEMENDADPWHIVGVDKDDSDHTFKNLKGNTLYGFYVMAIDEEGNMTQYPYANGCVTAKTLAPDAVAPTVLNKAIEVVRVTDETISIKWEKATDDRDKAKDIRYEVNLTEAENPADPWHLVSKDKDICEYTFAHLKPATLYGFCVMAFDKAGNMTQYPLANGCMTAKTLEDKEDKLAPTVLNKNLEVVDVTDRTISIKWEKATDDTTRPQDIRYIVGLTEADNPEDPWHIVRDEKNIGAHTFKNLKAGTCYAFYVMAYDEVGNFCQYPLYNGSMSATTAEGDSKAPIAVDKKLNVVDVTEDTISIMWERAKDDMTKAKDIRYVVGLTETDNNEDPWHICGIDKNICKFTFENLKPGTNYSFYVMAYDEAGNMTQYPGLDKSETTMTLKPVKRGPRH